MSGGEDGYQEARRYVDEIEALMKVQAPLAWEIAQPKFILVRLWLDQADSLIEGYMREEEIRLGYRELDPLQEEIAAAITPGAAA